MNRYFHISFVILLLLLAGSRSVHAQSKDPLTNKKIKKAQEYILKKKYDKARKYLRFSVNKVTDKEAIWAELARLSMRNGDFADAAEYFRMAMNAGEKNRDIYILQLIDALVKSGNYLEAEYLIYPLEEDPKWTQSKKRLYRNLKTFIYAKNILNRNNKDTVSIENVGKGVNSKYDDYFPSVTHDDSILIFTRKQNGIEEDFYISHRDSCDSIWMEAENMGYPPNSAKNEGAQCMSYDRKYLYFMRCGVVSDNGWTGGECDLYFSHTSSKGWVAPVPFGATINTPDYEGMPSISSDNTTLYFVSNRAGGYGGLDIWKSEFRNFAWQVPVNLGPEINTPGDELSPYIASDNKTLYFSSTGHSGLGGADIFIARKEDDARWSEPANLGIPFNSPYEDISFTLLAGSDYGYFASNRAGGRGGMDIYKAKMNEKNKPQPITFISGVMVDSMFYENIPNGTIDIYEQDSLVKTVMSNHGDGSFFIALPPHKRYIFRARRYDYPAKEFEIYIDKEQQYPPVKLNLELVLWNR